MTIKNYTMSHLDMELYHLLADHGNHRGGGHRADRHTTFVIMISNDRRILCVQNPQGKWMLPGGFNDGERSTVAGAREVQEETGYNVNLSKSPFVIDGAWCKIFVVKGYPFPNHHARVKIFNDRGTPHETVDYGFYNPRTYKVESWDGNPKEEKQIFRGDFFRNINIAGGVIGGGHVPTAHITGGMIVHAAPVFNSAHFACGVIGGGHAPPAHIGSMIIHAPVVHPVHFTGGIGHGHPAIAQVRSGTSRSGGSGSGGHNTRPKLCGPPKRSPSGIPERMF